MSKPRRKTDEPLRASGHWRFELYDEKGNLKDVREAKNLVVNDGLDHIASYLMLGGSPTSQPDPMDYIAVGTDSTTVDPTNTALGSELFRQGFDTVTVGGTGVISCDTTLAAGDGTGAITESGIFNDASAGDMLNRVTFSAVNKGASDTLKVSFTLTFTSS